MDYERLLSSTGAYPGEILRTSDLKHPRKIAWIQCVGSRQVTPGGNSYCSAVCCTYTQKQVILTKDHDPERSVRYFITISAPSARILSDTTKEQKIFPGFDLYEATWP